MIELITLEPNTPHKTTCAEMLVDGFRIHWPEAWPTIEDALEELDRALRPENILIGAIEGSELVGWIGGLPMYNGHVIELHPMVVRADKRRSGVGRMLIEALEQEARKRGAHTLWLGTDDESNMTSVGGADLFPDPLEHLSTIRNLQNHPFEFYQKCGFTIAGIVPDANGHGKPDILMAKRI